jgi:uncharacterized membrane protein YphA (DoxX/SURF4 family)
MQKIFFFLGKLLISSIFIFSSFHDLIHWNATEQYIYNELSTNLHSGIGGKIVLQALDYIVPNLSVFFAIGVIIKFLGGISLLFSWKRNFGAFLLVLVVLSSEVFMHDFWNKHGILKAQEMVLFWNQIGILGGLLLLLSIKSEKKISTNEAKNSAK